MKSRLVLAACLVFVLLVSLVMPLATAYADYTEDILNNPNVLVNFNQLVVNTYTQNYTYNGDYLYLLSNNFSISSGHKFYVKINNSGNYNTSFGYAVNSSYTLLEAVTTSFDNIYTINSNFTNFYFYGSNSFTLNNVMVIDLTQMFGGVGNEPNLQQCRDLFVADYYAYNTGSAVSLSGINAYVEGYNDALSTLDVVYRSSDIYLTMFSYDTTHFTFGDNNSSLYFNGIVGLPLGMTLLPNDLITIDFRAILINTSSQIEFGYLVGSTFMPIATYTYDYFTLATLRRQGVVSFQVPVNMNTLYIRCVDSSAPNNSACITGLFYLSMRTSNAYSSLKDSFDLGYAQAKEYYDRLYARGGTQWTAIYQEGYYDYPNDDHYTFRDLITAAVDTPVQAMTNLFDFDILGVNMKTFYLSIFTLCVIFMILKLVL